MIPYVCRVMKGSPEKKFHFLPIRSLWIMYMSILMLKRELQAKIGSEVVIYSFRILEIGTSTFKLEFFVFLLLVDMKLKRQDQ
ncbi:hypothetical protein VIGAN_02074100 [Vigna angularis var. angularis]|uniref:Uncharacterized protein n=1 Tax=Vigna angularis var. angularis TaxID=157739 RepID=A0A0S3RBQ7_PHAAN|nr:hypothetical protein VIGAN_02074100 [Vigna angularis var. angularis]